jgi:peptidoglycan/xylan/chitin deacetylase (PgdA/CDA1 family)
MDGDLPVTASTPLPWVLMYHSIERYHADPYRVTVRPAQLDRQLDWLRRRGLRGVSMAELLWARRHGVGSHLVGLTFDDGYTDFVTEAMPALARYGFTATVFVIAAELGGENFWDRPGPRKTLMGADDIRWAADAGMEIGSHSLNHVRLPGVHGQALVDEVRRSRRLLGEVTGRDVLGFCYPYGGVGVREILAVREAGYDYACAVESSPLAGRYALPRTYVGDRDTAPRLFVKRARYRLAAGRAARAGATAEARATDGITR